MLLLPTPKSIALLENILPPHVGVICASPLFFLLVSFTCGELTRCTDELDGHVVSGVFVSRTFIVHEWPQAAAASQLAALCAYS